MCGLRQVVFSAMCNSILLLLDIRMGSHKSTANNVEMGYIGMLSFRY